MNEQFVNELAVALRKVGTIHTVGEEWHSYTGKIPVGGVPYCGQMVTRATYSALWDYAQAKGLVKTEAEWQTLSTANNGNVPFYSDGDGSTTFRMPKIVGYVKGASSLDEAGSYTKEGLPDHTHHIGIYDAGGSANGGGFIPATSRNAGSVIVNSGTNGESGNGNWTDRGQNAGYDTGRDQLNRASAENAIYGNSSHVTPETTVVMFGVYAFGAIVNAEVLDASTLLTALNRVETEVSNVGDKLITTQKCNQEITINGYETEYITISDLTPFKPVYIAAKNVSGKGTIDVIVTSGSVLDAPLSTSMVIQESQNAVIWFPVIPTGTSLEIAVGDNSGKQVKSVVVAYQ